MSDFTFQVAVGVTAALIVAAVLFIFKKVRQWAWTALKWVWAGITILPRWLRDTLCRLCGWSRLTEIQRYGVRIYLTPQAWKYLGKDDPASIGDRTKNDLVQGPFCIQCHRSLVHQGRAPFSNDDTVFQACIQCERRWTTVDDTIFLLHFKRILWNDLDAEMRKTSKIAPTGQNG